ncbi:S-layer homology domain-containing protein [Cohnella fermenti]|uniref:S-layer homology domain-containing protein n=1 Tax=Cohnella fermenti TaxID=2565925 RepID=A0A4S4BHC1_9BACL|nr:S-layer homology domain-containing protein [Cohnella fermenti]THF73943.1 S-layer homology domain-containing protein [Cohnella fermenti]
MKKMIVLMIAVAAFFTSVPALAATNNKPSSWAESDVNAAISAGLVPDRLKSNYQAAITRDEFAELLVQSIFKKVNKATPEQSPWDISAFLKKVDVDVAFTDTDADYIKVAYAIGAINGISDTEFAPDKLITRQEAATMLVNTVHYSSGIYFSEMIKKSYSDFNQVATWAQGQVLMSGSMLVLQGTGGKFDPLGTFTREQAILAMYRVYHHVNFGNLTLKGAAVIRMVYENTHYHVGKDYIYMDYPDETYFKTNADHLWLNLYDAWDDGSGDFPSLAQATATYLYSRLLDTSLPEVRAASEANKSITVDFGYMTYTTLTKDHVLEMKLKPGYELMTVIAGYHYGYPAIDVEPKIIG